MSLIILNRVFDLFAYFVRHFVFAMHCMRNNFDCIVIMTPRIDVDFSFLERLVMLHCYLS